MNQAKILDFGVEVQRATIAPPRPSSGNYRLLSSFENKQIYILGTKRAKVGQRWKNGDWGSGKGLLGWVEWGRERGCVIDSCGGEGWGDWFNGGVGGVARVWLCGRMDVEEQFKSLWCRGDL